MNIYIINNFKKAPDNFSTTTNNKITVIVK